MFSQKQEEPGEWAALPAEPFDRDPTDVLPETPAADPLTLGWGATTAGSIAVSLPADSIGSVSIGSGSIGSGSAAPASVPIPDP